MMNHLYKKIILITAIALASCDVPTQQYGRSSKASTEYSPFATEPTQGSGSSYDGDTDTSLTNTPPVDTPLDASHCSWSRDGINGFMSLASHLSPSENSTSEGAYTVCQSSEDQQKIYIQIKNPIEDAELCLIPTYQVGTSTTYIGEPRCFFARNPLKIYSIQVYRNRPGFSHLPVTGVMIMKDKQYPYPSPYNQSVLSPDAFIFCNEQLVHPQYPNSDYCRAFKQAGHYVYKSF